nr:unnamed protein product [Callosobruchus chinensis]
MCTCTLKLYRGNVETQTEETEVTTKEAACQTLSDEDEAVDKLRTAINEGNNVEELKKLMTDEWPREVYSKVHIVEGDILGAPKDQDLAIITSGDLKLEKGIARRYRERFGGIEELQAQGKGLGEVACLISSISVPATRDTVRDERFVWYMLAEKEPLELADTDTVYQAIYQLKEKMEQYGRLKVALPYSPTHCEDTILKTLEFIFSKSQAEVYVYKRDKISRRKTDAGQTQSSRLGQSKGKQSRREAVIVKSNGRSYAHLVRELRKDVNLNAVDVEVSKIRKTQKGDLLLEVRKGKAEDLKTAINNQMHGVQAARRTKQVVLHLNNLDSITTKEDIISALKVTLGDDVARCRVTSIRPAYGESQNATVIADTDVARLLLKKGTLLNGQDWMCRLHINEVKLLQINVDRGREAHDLLCAKAADLRADVILVAEPNKTKVTSQGWNTDARKDTAICIMSQEINVLATGMGSGYCWIETDSIVIYSCYFSPNALLETYEKELTELRESILSVNKETILGGDFNAKSAEWGMPYEDRRGEVTSGWIAEIGLIVLNTGNKPTFERGASSSIIDLTLATEGIARKCNQWEVLDEESLSLHNYISWNIDLMGVPLQHIQDSKTSNWILKHLDKGKFNTALQTLLKPKSIDNADQLMDTLTAACNQSMPRRANTSKRGPVYWWTQEIGELRRECLKARRAYTRKNLPEHAREIRGLNYKLARQTLRVAIKTSKSRCWKKLMEEVDDDIWGKGYRIVFKRTKLGPSLPNMSVERRRLVAEALFPSQPRVVYNTQPETPLNHFTIDELLAASEKLKAKKTPGVDCIPAEIIKIAVTEAPDIFLKVCNSALATGCFPTRWKCADLVLIPKKNRYIDTPSAYRALCVLDAAGKLLEHLILGRLVNHIESNDSLSCNQFGFRKGRSTIGAIEKIVAIARQAAVTVNRRKKICALVALDIKNAFNSAPRQKIVEELERIGVDRAHQKNSGKNRQDGGCANKAHAQCRRTAFQQETSAGFSSVLNSNVCSTNMD